MALQISDTTPRVQYTATSGQTNFSVPFEFFAVADLKVYNGTTLLTYNNSPSSASQYSVTGAGVTGGGSITLGSPGATLNDSITIVRDLAIERLSDFPVSGNFPIQTLNSELDKIVAMLQQLEEQFARTLQYPVTTTTGFDVDLPELVANRVLSVNADATALLAEQELGTFKGNWAASTSYQVRDLVKDTSNGNIYFVNAAHTSSGTQPLSSNTNSSKYDLIIDAAAATTSATNAATSASAAASSASAASTSASNAATSESNAATSESNASTSESNASTSATNASNSATAAATSASNAATSESNASTSETNAASSASAASSSATSASNSASTATTQASNASTSASNAATSESNAATSASNASTSASNAATSATNASNAQTAAETAQAAAEAAADSIDDTYLGAKASDPTVDNDGDPLTVGDWYFNTTSNQTFIYNGSSWDAIAPDLIGDTTPQLGGNLDTNGNDINFGDNDKAIFGTDSDLQIWHDGGNAYIDNSGEGSLYVRGSSLVLTDATGQSAFLIGRDEGATEIYHNETSSLKLETTSTGIDVTGTVVSDGLTVDGNTVLNNSGTTGYSGNLVLTLNDTANDYPMLRFTGTSGGLFMIRSEGSNSLRFWEDTGTTVKSRMFIEEGGDISFYEDTGTTPKFFWDASAESLGIGGASPAGTAFTVTNAGAEGLEIRPTGGLSGGTSITAYNRSGGAYIPQTYNASEHIFSNSGSSNEKMRIDSSGNVLVGTTVLTDVSSSGVGNEGAYIKGDGQIGLASSNQVIGIFNRKTSNGSIIELRKDGAKAGEIGTVSGTDCYLGSSTTADTGLRFQTDEIVPVGHAGGNRGDAIDLGKSNIRWKDFWLSGSIYIGGTTPANALDDYETGTWSVVLTPQTSGSITLKSSANLFSYTKIGDIVFLTGRIQVDSVSSPTGTLILAGLPFTSANLVDTAGITHFPMFTYGVDLASPISTMLEVGEGATNGGVLQQQDNAGWGGLDSSGVSANDFFTINGSYRVA